MLWPAAYAPLTLATLAAARSRALGFLLGSALLVLRYALMCGLGPPICALCFTGFPSREECLCWHHIPRYLWKYWENNTHTPRYFPNPVKCKVFYACKPLVYAHLCTHCGLFHKPPSLLFVYFLHYNPYIFINLHTYHLWLHHTVATIPHESCSCS